MNSKKNSIAFAFRRPRFPLICELDGDLFAALSPAALRRRLAGVELADEKKARFVDANGESWMFLQKEKIFAPKFFPRTWRKIEIIRMFNESRKAREMGLCYPERRLANRRLDMVVCDIAALLSGEVMVGKSRARKGDRENGTG
jgi:hypothetical protein